MPLLAPGTLAPNFKGINLTGPEINLENYKDKKTVALVFAPDRVDPGATNQVKAVYLKHRDQIELITVTRKIPGIAMAKAFLQQLGVNFPTLYDPAMNVYKAYGVENPVAMFIIDPTGTIVFSAQADADKVDVKTLDDAIVAHVK
ncbi:MAG: TlpA family protein disulfide reductase [Chloroflexi bacterium]|nr:TlpA family protein disulfide reductase [Chloroflexota bacterium]MBI3740442.1 TlpA family protein disulfide reductase [Chloroflexota bacterium]